MGSSKARITLVALAAVLAAALWLVLDGWWVESPAGAGGVRPLAERHARDSRALLTAATPEPAEQPEELAAAPSATPLAAAHETPPRTAAGERPVCLKGRVVLPAGAPIEPELTVVARGRADRERVETRAAVDAAGGFTLELPSATRRVSVTLEARYLYLGSPASVDLKDSSDELVLEPELGGRLLVRLIAPLGTDTEHLAGGLVSLFGGLGQFTRTGRTDESGGASFDALPAGLGLKVSSHVGDFVEASSGAIVLQPGGERAVELVLEPGVRLSGVVRGQGGSPLEGARVNHSIHLRGSHTITSTAVGPITDADGAFDLRGLGAGHIALRVRHPEHLSGELELGELAVGEIREGLEIVLASGQRIAGRVMWPDGRPAEGLRVTLEHPDREPGISSLGSAAPRARTDAEGRFELSGLRRGPYALSSSARPTPDVQERLQAAGHLSESGPRRPTLLARADDVLPGSESIELVLVSGESIRGRVLDSAGRPFERATLLVRRIEEEGALDAPRVRAARLSDGAFELPGFQPGTYELAASAGAGPGAPLRIQVPQAGAGALLVAPRGVRLEGRVLIDGEPASRADVSLNAKNESFSLDDFSGRVHAERWRRTRTDAEGRFDFEPVGPGSYYLEAAQAGRGKSARLEVHISAGTAPASVLLEIEAAGWIEGRLDSSLAPLGGRRLSASQVGGDSFARATTDAEGRFEVADLLPGTYRIELRSEREHEHDSRRLLASAQVEVASGRATPLVLMAPGGPVRLALQVRSGGRPIAGQEVRAWLTSVGHRHVEGRSDSGGRLELELPESGAASFELGGEVGGVIREERWVPAQDEVQLVFDLPEGELSGRLVGRDGNPAAHARVVLLHLARTSQMPPARSSQADAEGRFAFLHVGPGDYRLVAGGRARSSEAPGFEERYGQAISEPFHLAEGQRLGDLRLALPAPATVQGRVRDGAGESRTIHAFRMDGSIRVHGGHAMVRDGRYRLSGLGPGPHDIEVGGGPSHRVRRVNLAEGELLELDFDLD